MTRLRSHPSPRSRRRQPLILVAAFACLLPFHSPAQQAPAEYADLYATTQSELTNFAATVNSGWDGSKPAMQFTGELYPATSVSMPTPNFLQTTIIPYLNGLQSLGVKTIKFSINFPVLYQPYYDSPSGANNPAGYQQTLAFYQAVVTQVRQRGMKVIIPTQNVFPYQYTTTTPYFQTLTLAQYSAARSAMAQTIATQLQPDYLIVQSEPVTEVGNLPASLGDQLSDPATDLNMVRGILTDLENAGLRTPALQLGAGMGTWQPNFSTFLSGLVSLPMDLLCVHVYPVNDRTVAGQNVDFLARILQMADAAHAQGMKVGMGECWVNKETDGELSVSTSDKSIDARNVYGFWAPLDQLFLQTMTDVGYWKGFEFINPFDSFYYFAYLDYDQTQPLIQGMTSAQAADFLEKQENKASYAAFTQGQTTSTGALWSQLATAAIHPSFFAGESPLPNGVYYLGFPDGNHFGEYSYLSDPGYIYSFDLGYEYLLDANDGQGGIYLYDFTSGTFFFTSPSFPYPYLYDFTLNRVLYYYQGTMNPRSFYDFGTGNVITK